MAMYRFMPLDEVSGESNYLVAGQESNSPASWWRPQRTLPAIACLCMLFGALLTSGRAPARHYLLGGQVGKIEQLFTDDDPCKDFDYISIDRVIHKNLGNAGPDSGAEGMVYEGMDKKKRRARQPCGSGNECNQPLHIKGRLQWDERRLCSHLLSGQHRHRRDFQVL